MKILCVAEKPSIAKAVANLLSNNRAITRNSPSKYNKNFDFRFDFGGQLGQCDVTMTSVSGHLTSCDFPKEYQWGNCRPIELFDAPIVTKVVGTSQVKVEQNLVTEGSKCDRLMIWTDCDREGEYIGFEILNAVRKRNSRIDVHNTLRAQFAHLERSHVIHAAKNPRTLQMGLVDAVQTRIELDLRLGYAFSRLLDNLLKKRSSNDSVYSYGTCQFPTLGFVVDRYKRHREFQSETFWYIKLTTVKDSIKTDFTWTKPNFFDRLSAVVLYSNCLGPTNSNKYGTIVEKNERPVTNYKPLPLTTVELQKICSQQFKFTAKETLKLAEDLYTKGFISYPRTETNKFPAKMDLKKLIEAQFEDPKWGQYAKSLIHEDKFRQPRGGSHNDEAHPPIHPTGYPGAALRNFTQKQIKVYEFVVRHFLACCSDDAVGSQTSVKLKWGPEFFSANALEVKARNYLDIYPFRSWASNKERIPNFALNEQVEIFKAELKDGKTTPPNFLTESELISLMDANGIGTDATIGEHIDKILQRKYILQHKQGAKTFILPSEIGMGLVSGFENISFHDNLSLTKPFLRKNLEIELAQISEGRKTKKQVLDDILPKYQEAFSLTMRHSAELLRTFEAVRKENQDLSNKRR